MHNQEINEYPEEMREEYARLSDWVRETYAAYGLKVWIKVIDPQSLVGMWKHIKYRVRDYPTFVLDGAPAGAGWQSVGEVARQIDALVRARQEEPTAAPAPS